ncbi:hypothetical protein KSP40_PGU007998 [Platanthera guangdongensis]|uniref:Gnk2-homologous domain-containing protein n=1 Tax=Platanthera guangdongensis TaxID=2320717 RepID=A0ABR2M805_9ASPA
MDFSHQLFLLALLLPLAACINPTYQHCGQNFTGNSILQDNINKTIYSMIANTPDSGYAVSTIDNGSNTVYGLARCRRDIGPKACSDCIVVASQDLRAICPETSASHIWRDLCFLRYEITNFLETIDNSYLKGRRSTKEADSRSRRCLLRRFSEVFSVPVLATSNRAFAQLLYVLVQALQQGETFRHRLKSSSRGVITRLNHRPWKASTSFSREPSKIGGRKVTSAG